MGKKSFIDVLSVLNELEGEVKEKKFTAEEVLTAMAGMLTEYLYELKEICADPRMRFQRGAMTAFVECLEYIQRWEKSEEVGLDFDVEEKFPIYNF